jgi:hypothetical protein
MSKNPTSAPKHRVVTHHLRSLNLDRFAMSGGDGAFQLSRLTPEQVRTYKERVMDEIDRTKQEDGPLLGELCYVEGYLHALEKLGASGFHRTHIG